MSVKKVLVIRFRRIGDAVLSVVICSSIRKSFPEAEIHYVLNDHIAPLFENHPDIDKIITFSDEENNHFFKYLRKVRQLMKTERYDVIIDTRATIKTLWFSAFPEIASLGIMIQCAPGNCKRYFAGSTKANAGRFRGTRLPAAHCMGGGRSSTASCR